MVYTICWSAASDRRRRRLELEVLEDRCLPSTAATFVESLYYDFLGRTGSPTEIQNWVNAIPTIGNAGVANGVIRSPEGLTHAVDAFYVQLLNRQAAGGEEMGWVDQLEMGATEEQVLAGILASPEFGNRADAAVGAKPSTSYVTELYRIVLGRAASSSEIDGWVNALPSLGRSGVALGFLDSPEFRTDLVQQLYGFAAAPAGTLASAFPPLLGRTSPPAPAEINYWVGSGLDILTVQVDFGASPEYVQGAYSISGQVTVDTTGIGIPNVTVELIDAAGTIVQTTLTSGAGKYQFSDLAPGPYVVHAVAPTGFVQTAPTFTTTAPVPGYGAPFQSPINLTGPTTDLSQYLQINYVPTLAPSLIETDHDLQVDPNPSADDSISLNGSQFVLKQFHFHYMSENTVNGQPYTMEEHFVNVNAAGAITVVAVFLQLGADNPGLDPILSTASANLTFGVSESALAAPIDLADLLPTSMQGWYYQGSLTTFPYSTPVNWFVLSTPITLSSSQLAEYQAVASGFGFLPNARSTQPLDGRQLNQIDNDVNLKGHMSALANFAFHPTD